MATSSARSWPERAAAVLLALAAAAFAVASPAPQEGPVRAAVGRHCTSCHAGASASGALDLTDPARLRAAWESGRIRRAVEEGRMPPPPARLPAADTALLTAPSARATGGLWSLRLVRRPAVPRVKASARVRTPIDAFVLAELEKRGWGLAPEADRRTLLRRVTLDLTGLPPTPAAIAAFLADKKPGAYERVVDRLLSSPAYGERWARHWLDVARFGESHGFERDQIRDHAWRYRDWVIDALNRDLPYDRFVRAQIAGDVLAPVTSDGIVATGFLVAAPWDEVGQSQVSVVMRKRVREEEMEEMVGTTAQAFLGLTIHCARCHDHKYDPIPQTDYYRFRAALDGVRHGTRSLRTPQEEAARNARRAALSRQRQQAEGALDRLIQTGRTRVLTARGEAPPTVAGPQPMARWTFEGDARDTLGGLDARLEGGARIEAGRLVLDGTTAFAATAPLPRPLREKTLEAWVALTDTRQRGGGVVGVETLGGGVFDTIVFGEQEAGEWIAGSDNFRRTRDAGGVVETSDTGTLVHLAIVYSADGTIRLYRNGAPYGAPYRPDGSDLQTFGPSARVLFGLRHTGAANGFLRGAVEEARLYDRALTPDAVQASFRSGVPPVDPAALTAALTPDERRERVRLTAERDRLRDAEAELAAPALTYAATPREPDPTFVLARGDVESPRARVGAGGLSACAPAFSLPPDTPEAQRRIALANWITDPRNPLTARVMVNRLWQGHFGRGIVGTSSDFGANGEKPSHPELLDWLASELVRQGWSLKKLHRQIVVSAVYRQASRYAAKPAAADVEARTLWRFPPRRLEGEAVRDAMLATSGLLNPQRGGPGFRPFTLTINNSHFYTLEDRAGPVYDRRTIYRIAVHSARSPFLESLDCPDPSTRTARRTPTVTPLQALELMNNAFVLRQARALAARAATEAGKGESAGAVSRAFVLALGRRPTASELSECVALARRDGLPAVAWVLLNSSEFVSLR